MLELKVTPPPTSPAACVSACVIGAICTSEEDEELNQRGGKKIQV